MKSITVQELKAKIDAGTTIHLVDVREPKEYQAYNIGGQLMPVGNIPFHIGNGDFEPMLEAGEIVMVCRSGKRSAMAQQLLAGAGIPSTNLTGGVLAWADAFDKA